MRGIIKDGKIKVFDDLSKFEGEVDIVIRKKTRTTQQNKALHLFLSQLADELNEKGFDMRAIIRDDIEISWTTQSVKDKLWRPLQKILTGKESTTKLSKTQEIDIIYDNLNRIIIERTKGEVQIPFPCIDTMLDKL